MEGSLDHMHVLILQRPKSTTPYEQWIAELARDARISILSSRETIRSDGDLRAGTTRFLVDRYDSLELSVELHRICAEDRPDRIIVNSEDDVLRAAEARTVFDIPGQRSRMAVQFRDKIAMKQLFENAGLPAVPYRAAQCVEDLLDAQREHGTIVVKPRDGAGSVGVRVLRTRAQVLELGRADPVFLAALHGGRLMAEKYVDGPVYHVDVVVDRDHPVLVSPSRYTVPPHRFATENLGSVMLDEDSSAARLLTEAARRFVTRLPAEHGTTVLHLEFLEDGEGRFLAGEVACRIGGAWVKNAIRHTYGVDISRLSCLLAAGLWHTEEDLRRVGPPSGWLLQNGGPPLAAPAGAVRWLVEQHAAPRVGAPSTSVDASAKFLVAGENEYEIHRRLAMLAGHC
jgi:hypothetical protein